MWYREGSGKNTKWAVRKVIEIPAEPADPEKLPPLLARLLSPVTLMRSCCSIFS